MTVATISRYDDERVPDRRGRAVVIGAGVAGLLAARVLADAFETVTVIERDALPDRIEPRCGVPQGDHVHVLLEGGRRTIEDLCPGFGDELSEMGGVVASGAEFQIYVEGEPLATTDRQSLHLGTRALYEYLLRRRVASHERVEVRPRCRFIEYVADRDATAVEGVTIRTRDSETERLPADLVVDAAGRTSRTPAWLERRGYEPPSLDEIHIDLAYASVFVERPSDDRYGLSMEAEAPRTRGAFVFPVEGDRWLVNLHGTRGDHPPTDPARFRAFAESLHEPIVADLLREHPMTSEDVAFYPFPASRRYRYEDLEAFPDGLVVVGDGIASFNPVNGQGMTVAALEALLLHHELAGGRRRGTALRFFDAAADVVDIAWDLVSASDLAFSQSEGALSWRTAAFDWFLGRFTRRAHTDPTLSNLMWEVFMMERPPTALFRPQAVWRVFAPRSTVRSRTVQPTESLRGGRN
jgi:flavin-dependent dehydrogenase